MIVEVNIGVSRFLIGSLNQNTNKTEYPFIKEGFKGLSFILGGDLNYNIANRNKIRFDFNERVAKEKILV